MDNPRTLPCTDDHDLAGFETPKAKWEAILALQAEKVARAKEACELQRIRVNAMVDEADSELSKLVRAGHYRSKFRKIVYNSKFCKMV